ncbi:MAG: radical SAM protein, partial [Candidatus Altiarchaeota archaeon]|nr:radical SAM protein [Candidatus Altiarchaeota archaeon]
MALIGPSDFVKDYQNVPFRIGRLDHRFLVTTDFGSWAVLNKDELELLQSHRVDESPALFSMLLSSGIISTDPNFGDAKRRLKDKLWHLSNGSSLHVIAVTNACNFACKYCYADAETTNHMSVETSKKVVDFMFQSPAKTLVVEFSGGEPLLNFDAIKTVVEAVNARKSDKRIGFAMIHNGSNWDMNKVNFFLENRIGVCFSLDGPEDIHNLHRPYRSGGGTYKDVVKWIRILQKSGFNGLNALPVITKHSLSRGREIVDEYLSHGFRIVRFKYLGYFGRAVDKWDELGYTPEEFLVAWKDVVEYMYELNNRGILVQEGLSKIIAQKLFNRTDPGYCELQMPCGAGLNQVAYAPDGKIYTCDEGRMFEEFNIGTINETYGTVMKNSTLKSLVLASSGLFNICSSCELKPFCGVCPV